MPSAGCPTIGQLRRQLLQNGDQRRNIAVVMLEECRELIELLLPKPHADDADVDHDKVAVLQDNPEVDFGRVLAVVFPDGSTSTVVTTSSPALTSIEPVTRKYWPEYWFRRVS